MSDIELVKKYRKEINSYIYPIKARLQLLEYYGDDYRVEDILERIQCSISDLLFDLEIGDISKSTIKLSNEVVDLISQEIDNLPVDDINYDDYDIADVLETYLDMSKSLSRLVDKYLSLI